MKRAHLFSIFFLGWGALLFAQPNTGNPKRDALFQGIENEAVEKKGDPAVLAKIESFGLQAKREDDSLSILFYYRLKSHFYHGTQRYKEALDAALIGVQINPELNPQVHFQLLLDVISNYWNLGEHSKAVPYLIRGENRLTDTGVTDFSKAIFFNFLGLYHYNEYASEKALRFFLQGDSLLGKNMKFREIEFIWQQNFKSNIGLALLDLKKYKEAGMYFDQAYSISKSINNRSAMGFALMNKVLSIRHAYPDSSFAPTLRQALQLVKNDADFSLRISVLRELAKDYLLHEESDSLRAILPELETAVEYYPAGNSKVKLLFYLARFNRYLENDRFLDYFDRALALKDSLMLNPQGQNLLQIERQRNLDLKEQEAINLAEIKAEQLRKNIRLTTFFLFTAIGFLILLVGVLMALFRKDRRLRKTLKNLRWQISNSDTLNQQLQLSMQQKNLLLGAVAHDLRNLLVNVNQVSEMMINRELEGVPDFKDRMVKLMERSSRLGMHTIEDLIEGVQPEGRQRLRLELVRPVDCLSFVSDLLSFKAEKKGLIIRVNQADEMPSIMADRDKLNRALINLLDNAIKFSPIDSIVDLGCHLTEDFLVFTIKDFGKGIHRARYSEGLNPFADEGQPGTLGEPSTGLGLFIVRKIAELHQGQFTLFSKDGEGTIAKLMIYRSLH
jgi:signal transduction histidine kinase